jgi:hypothetical protein
MTTPADTGCQLARIALERANDAADGAKLASVKADEAKQSSRSVYNALGQIQRELGALRAEVQTGFASTAVRIETQERRQQDSQNDIDKLEDTQVTMLKDELQKSLNRLKELRDNDAKRTWWVLGIAATIIAGLVVALVAKFTH